MPQYFDLAFERPEEPLGMQEERQSFSSIVLGRADLHEQVHYVERVGQFVRVPVREYPVHVPVAQTADRPGQLLAEILQTFQLATPVHRIARVFEQYDIQLV